MVTPENVNRIEAERVAEFNRERLEVIGRITQLRTLAFEQTYEDQRAQPGARRASHRPARGEAEETPFTTAFSPLPAEEDGSGDGGSVSVLEWLGATDAGAPEPTRLYFKLLDAFEELLTPDQQADVEAVDFEQVGDREQARRRGVSHQAV